MSVMSLSVSAVDTALTDEETTAVLTKMIRADIDGDGEYSTKDATTLLRAAAGIEPAEADYDIDLDGQVSVLDAQKMLRVAADLDNIVDDEILLMFFTDSLNGIKVKKPGFSRTITNVCSSIKVTTSGAPISSLNVSNMEYRDYVNTFVNVMNTFPYNSMLNDEMKKDLEDMKKSAVDVYKPQIEKKNVAATSNSHYTNFPVSNLGWSCRLEMSDIKTIKHTASDGKFIVTVTLNNYTYGKGEYPTGTSGFTDRQKLPYGKIFNLPDFNGNDGSVVNSTALKDGVVILTLDMATGKVTEVDYSYSYTSSITSAKAEGSDMIMKTVTNANTNENYVIG